VNVREVLVDGVPTFVGECPNCGEEQELDDDQFHGQVSSQCSFCEWHETVDWSPFLEENEKG